MANNTPKFWTKLFKWFCKDSYFEELQGDLEENYLQTLNTEGIAKANSNYRKEVVRMIRGSVIQPTRFIPSSLRLSLFRMHIILSLRSIKRNWSFTILNVVGFAAAISICLFITNIVLTAYKLDQSFTNKENKYRISSVVNDNKKTRFTGFSPAIIYSHLPAILPEAKSIAGFRTAFLKQTFRGVDIDINAIDASPNFLTFLDYEVLKGSINDVINNPKHVAVTEDFIQKYSLEEDIIGKQFNGFIISAVLESAKIKSHLDFEWLNFSKELNQVLAYESYIDRSRANYIEVHDEANLVVIHSKLNRLAKQINDTLINKSYKFQLENLSTLGLSEASSFQSDLLTQEGVNTMIIFILVMAIIASINYTNLANAKAMHRLKEVGVRKVIGSKRHHVFSQFLIETCLLGLLGLIIGFFLYYWFAQEFATLVPFAFDTSISVDTLIAFLCISVIVSLLAGIIPGLYLSKISPLNLFNQKGSGKTFGFQMIRKILMVIQLTITAFVFVFGSLFWKQYDSYQKEDLGMELSHNYFLEFEKVNSLKNLYVFNNELQKLPEIEASSFTSKLIPIEDVNGLAMFKTENRTDSIMTSFSRADTSFIQTYQPEMELFDRSIFGENNSSLLVNKSLLKQLNIPLESALGTNLRYGNALHPIAGIFKNSISSNYTPIYSAGKENQDNYSEAILVYPNFVTNILVARTSGSQEALAKIEKTFLKVFPEKQIAFRSLEDLAQNRYPEMKKMITVFSYIFICIILVTLMGQMGMAIFNAETRTKELGIRKVLGASVTKLSIGLIKGTFLQTCLALTIAVPISVLLFLNAMGDYRNRLEIDAYIMAPIILLFVGIILLMVLSLTAPKAAVNPANSLRNE